MLSDKELKQIFKIEANKHPEKFYSVNFLEKKGFIRKKCFSCKKYFWTTHSKKSVCGDAACEGGVSMFDSKPNRNKMSYEEVWTNFSVFFKKRGYKVIKRYPVVSRWNPTTDFTIASIAAFQPHVISGEVDPPFKKLVIPQFCLRFGDVDNVGITGSHNTGFVMIGQHVFVPPKDWNQEKYFKDIYEYAIEIIGLSKTELTIHEDAWAGGGNFGPCMEFFAYGIELFNQVYMLFEQTENGRKELNLKVLDMGLGMERIAWFTQGTITMYDAVFPEVISYLKKETNVKFDLKIYKKFSPFSSLLNIDEVENINTAWKNVANKVGVSPSVLKKKILPMTAIYSLAEHSRSLLFALSDGALPSNVGGFYNLRVIFRRAMSFIDQFGWDVNLIKLVELHAQTLKKVFPEVSEKLNDVKTILEVEKQKYVETKQRSKSLLQRVLKTKINLNKLFELYDSHGITPELIREEAIKQNIKIKIPEDFYKRVSERHEKREIKTKTKTNLIFNLENVPITESLYFKNYLKLENKGKIIKKISKYNNHYLILDKSVFYPTSGGQVHDIGKIIVKGIELKVLDVIKIKSHILHVIDSFKGVKVNDDAFCKVNKERRIQLTQHHSTAHILNAAARKILGNHIWQAGAAKTLEKGRLDITHYTIPTFDELKKIENLANKIVKSNVKIKKTFLDRTAAEKKYGFALYQGGVAPGKRLRIVEIEGLDIEACGGTHLNFTGETGIIKLTKVSKVQDGVIRIEYTSGSASLTKLKETDMLIKEIEQILNVKKEYLVGRVEELFSKWKKARKAIRKNKKISSLSLEIKEKNNLDDEKLLTKLALILNVQKEHLPNTIKRFLKDIYKFQKDHN